MVNAPPPPNFIYSQEYSDTLYFYRHIRLPHTDIPIINDQILSEEQWRSLGIQLDSYGEWEHYGSHIIGQTLLFRKLINANITI